MDRNRLKYLYESYKRKTLTKAESLEWNILVQDPHMDLELREILDSEWRDYNQDELLILNPKSADIIYNDIIVEPAYNQINKLWPRLIGVAATVTIISFSIWFYSSRQQIVNPNSKIASQNDIAPGKNGATLTLSDGKKIRLSTAKKGELLNKAGIRISKTADGQLIYEVQAGTALNNDRFNTLTTEKGETFKIRLPDNTMIWLNADSRLTYPENIATAGLRKVNLRGEGYFQVAKKTSHPFIVATENQLVEVLGTHFNVNAYEQVTKTTLEEGSVKVSSGKNEQIINPGQQAVTRNHQIAVINADMDEALAWKNGYFRFKAENITTIMTKLSRWYNIEVVYMGDPGTETFTGTVSRDKNISQALKMLQNTNGVKFKIEGRRITVIP